MSSVKDLVHGSMMSKGKHKAKHKNTTHNGLGLMVLPNLNRRLIAGIMGSVLITGGVMAGIGMNNGNPSTTPVARPTAAEAANRSMNRAPLLLETVSVDTSKDTQWTGTSVEEVKKHMDEMTQQNDDAAQAKASLKSIVNDARKMDLTGFTDASRKKLDDQVRDAEKVLGMKDLQSKDSYLKSRKAVEDAVNGLEKEPAPVVSPPAPSPSGTGTPAVPGHLPESSTSGTPGPIGVTVPANEMQSWFHDYLLSNGYTEEDFTAGVWIINRESGWNPRATNPSSGAYGLAQALPGGKMATHGADWATNYQTQLKWFVDYCNGRYGGIQQSYNWWVSHGWY